MYAVLPLLVGCLILDLKPWPPGDNGEALPLNQRKGCHMQTAKLSFPFVCSNSRTIYELEEFAMEPWIAANPGVLRSGGQFGLIVLQVIPKLVGRMTVVMIRTVITRSMIAEVRCVKRWRVLWGIEATIFWETGWDNLWSFGTYNRGSSTVKSLSSFDWVRRRRCFRVEPKSKEDDKSCPGDVQCEPEIIGGLRRVLDPWAWWSLGILRMVLTSVERCGLAQAA